MDGVIIILLSFISVILTLNLYILRSLSARIKEVNEDIKEVNEDIKEVTKELRLEIKTLWHQIDINTNRLTKVETQIEKICE